MQSLEPQVYDNLKQEAKEQGLTVQALLRTRIIPEWKEAYEALQTPGMLASWIIKKRTTDYARGHKAGRSATKHEKRGRPRAR